MQSISKFYVIFLFFFFLKKIIFVFPFFFLYDDDKKLKITAFGRRTAIAVLGIKLSIFVVEILIGVAVVQHQFVCV
jgi:hypothetical protein